MRRRWIISSVGSVCAAVAAFVLLIDGRELTGGVWLCAAVLFGILSELESRP